MDAKALIIDLGDYGAIAKKTGINSNTVASWKARNNIPRRAWPDLLDAYKGRLSMAKLKKAEKPPFTA